MHNFCKYIIAVTFILSAGCSLKAEPDNSYYSQAVTQTEHSSLNNPGMTMPDNWKISQVGGLTPGCRRMIFKNTFGMSFVYIPAGTFNMGSPNDELNRDPDERLHRVKITEGFFMQATEVTQQQWTKVMGENPSHFGDADHKNYPVENVSWMDAHTYLEKLNERQNNVRYRLPTEAEWEYACRAGTNTAFYSGRTEKGEKGYNANLDAVGWYHRNSNNTTHPVAMKKPNLWGLFDMHGNVWEWCSDWMGEYPVTPAVDPGGSKSGHARIRRGGSWNHYPMFCRSANRSWYDPHGSNADIGLRLVAETLEKKAKPNPAVTKEARPQMKPVPQSGPCKKEWKEDGLVKIRQGVPNGTGADNTLYITRNMPEEIRVGENFQYTITINNKTDCPVPKVILTEDPASRFTVKSTQPQARNVEGDKLRWDIAPLPANSSKTFTVEGITNSPGKVRSCATVDYSFDVCTETMAIQPALEITKKMPGNVTLGDDVKIHITVSNTGNGTAEAVEVKDELPRGLKSKDSKRQFVFNAGNLAVGQSEEYLIVAEAAETGNFTNTAVAEAKGGLRTQASADITVRAPNLTLTKTGASKQFVGRNVIYTITLKNSGNADADNVVLEDRMPQAMQFVSASHNGTANGTHVKWLIDNLQRGETVERTVTMKPREPGKIKNLAIAGTDNADTVRATKTTEVEGIAAILLEVSDETDPLEVGETGWYIIVATNQGSLASTNIEITCLLEENIQYVSSSAPTNARTEGKQVNFAPLASIPAGDKAIWRVKVKAVKTGDVRFKAQLNSDQLERPVGESEATTIY